MHLQVWSFKIQIGCVKLKNWEFRGETPMGCFALEIQTCRKKTSLNAESKFKRTLESLWKLKISVAGILGGDRTVWCLRSDRRLRTEAGQTIRCLDRAVRSLLIWASCVLDQTVQWSLYYATGLTLNGHNFFIPTHIWAFQKPN